jgi:hypothetical protein
MADPTPDPDLAALRALLDAMTPGPWRECRANESNCSCGLVRSLPADAIVATVMVREEWAGGSDGTCNRADARGIAALRNAAEALLARCEAAEAEVARLRQQIEDERESAWKWRG